MQVTQIKVVQMLKVTQTNVGSSLNETMKFLIVVFSLLFHCDWYRNHIVLDFILFQYYFLITNLFLTLSHLGKGISLQ